MPRCAITIREDRERGSSASGGVFHPFQSDLSRLIVANQGVRAVPALAVCTTTASCCSVASHRNWSIHAMLRRPGVRACGQTHWNAYIPVKEMLAHAGFLSTAARREIAFEEVYVDILRQAFLPKLKGDLDPDRQRLLDLLRQAIGGKVISKGSTSSSRTAAANWSSRCWPARHAQAGLALACSSRTAPCDRARCSSGTNPRPT